MKCVGKVLIYHPPKFQLSSMIWHCCSLAWMLWGVWIHSIENCSGVVILSLLKLALHKDAVRNVYELQTEASLLWFEKCIPSWHAHCIARAREEMESAPSFLAAILWVLMLPISETKFHPCLMRALAGASISLSLQMPCTENMYSAERACYLKWRAPRVKDLLVETEYFKQWERG